MRWPHWKKMWTIGLGWCGIMFWRIWYGTNPVLWEGGKRKKKIYDERKKIFKQNRETNIKSVLNACEFQFVILDYILTIIVLSIV